MGDIFEDDNYVEKDARSEAERKARERAEAKKRVALHRAERMTIEAAIKVVDTQVKFPRMGKLVNVYAMKELEKAIRALRKAR